MLNNITCGNCLDLIDNIPDEFLSSSVIDPPYGERMGYAGDDSVEEASILLENYLDKLFPKLKQDSHIAVFWTMRNLDVCLDIIRKKYTFRRILTMYLPFNNSRPYLGFLSKTLPIVIAQKYLPCKMKEFQSNLAIYLKEQMKSLGYTASALSLKLECSSSLVGKWTTNSNKFCLPTAEFYSKLKELLKLDERYDFLLKRDHMFREHRVKDFEYKHDCYVIKEKKKREMFHPSEKPLFIMEHLVSCLTPTNEFVLDGFAGSGSTLLAAKNMGRQYIGFEMDDKFCQIAKQRLAI